jgi:hypothetical protein
MRGLGYAFLCIAFVAPGQAQQSAAKANVKALPDLSGTWVMDKLRSKAGDGVRVDLAEVHLTIWQKDPEIRITRKIDRNGLRSLQETVYSTAPPPEIKDVKSVEDDAVPKVHTRWMGRKLVTTVSTTIKLLDVKQSTVRMEMTEEWQLSKDGRTLTQTVESTGVPNAGPHKARFVFIRAS